MSEVPRKAITTFRVRVRVRGQGYLALSDVTPDGRLAARVAVREETAELVPVMSMSSWKQQSAYWALSSVPTVPTRRASVDQSTPSLPPLAKPVESVAFHASPPAPSCAACAACTPPCVATPCAAAARSLWSASASLASCEAARVAPPSGSSGVYLSSRRISPCTGFSTSEPRKAPG
eukprot:scaffold110637_cov48-Phaeocystis_antarctica.AAC.1